MGRRDDGNGWWSWWSHIWIFECSMRTTVNRKKGRRKEGRKRRVASGSRDIPLGWPDPTRPVPSRPDRNPPILIIITILITGCPVPTGSKKCAPNKPGHLPSCPASWINDYEIGSTTWSWSGSFSLGRSLGRSVGWRHIPFHFISLRELELGKIQQVVDRALTCPCLPLARWTRVNPEKESITHMAMARRRCVHTH